MQSSKRKGRDKERSKTILAEPDSANPTSELPVFQRTIALLLER
jgi:hypothetical protein